MKHTGKGCKINIEKAEFWYRKAAELEDSYGLRFLGWLFQTHYKDFKLAFKYYKKSALLNNGVAMNDLGSFSFPSVLFLLFLDSFFFPSSFPLLFSIFWGTISIVRRFPTPFLGHGTANQPFCSSCWVYGELEWSLMDFY